MRIRQTFFSLAVIGLVGTSMLRAQAPSAADQAALTKLATDYSAAWAKGDSKALAAMFTADAVEINADGKVHAGRAAIEKDFADQFAGALKGTTLKIMAAPGDRALKADVALGHGTFEIHKGADVIQAGTYQLVDVKTAGGWQITQLTGLVPQAPPAAAAPAPAKKKP